MSLALFRRVIPVIALCAVTGCQDTDLTSSSKYADVIGAEYRTKTELYALGVYREIGKKDVGSIRVSPEQQTGPEIAFRRLIPIGHVVRVLAVRKRFIPLENGIEFVVAVDEIDLPAGVEVVVPLYGYMQTTDGFPDSNRFERLREPLR